MRFIFLAILFLFSITANAQYFCKYTKDGVLERQFFNGTFAGTDDLAYMGKDFAVVSAWTIVRYGLNRKVPIDAGTLRHIGDAVQGIRHR